MFANMELSESKIYKSTCSDIKKIKLFKCKDCDYRGATRGDLKDHLNRNMKKHRDQKEARENGKYKYPTIMQSIIEKHKE